MHNLLLHIGFPKTGSSFLQKLFFPKSSQINFIRDEDLYKLLALDIKISSRERKKKIFLSKERLFKKDKINVISFEHFVMPANCLKTTKVIDHPNYLEPERIINNVKDLDMKVKVLIIIRNQKDWLWSWYQERIKRYETRTFDNMIACAEFQKIIDVINYDKTFDLWKSNFYDCRVVPFELLKFDKELFIKNLCSYLNINLFKVENKVIKSSLSYFSVRLKRRVNLLLVYFFKLTNNKIVRSIFIKMIKIFFSFDFIFKKIFRKKYKPKIPVNLEKRFTISNNKLSKRIDFTLKKIGYY